MTFLKYDLHTHTTASDGVLSPRSLYDMALQLDIKTLAITDHDTVNGIKELMSLQERSVICKTITLISGAEFSCLLGKQILHVVALNIDLNNPLLIKHLLFMEELREQRAERIAKKLIKCKLPDTLALVKIKAAGAQIGRPHFAKVLCDLKIVESEAQAFKKYLGAGKPANVSVAWPDLEEVINVISDAGGVAVLAHPTKYNLTMSKLRRIIASFKSLGGDAIEVSYPGMNIEQQSILKYEIEKHKLMISAGSDFHTTANKWIELGRYPVVPKDIPHVLSRCLA
ncbi:MAG: PHP domain-containing protein [Oceanospirillaceae bacterium]